MTRNQFNVLSTLRSLPATHRVHRKAGGHLLLVALDCYDGRTLRSLFVRGWLAYTETGVVITNSGLLALRERRESGKIGE